MRHVLSILVQNHAGVLSRVSGLFSRRGFNIDSLSVGTTEDPDFSRLTVSVQGDDLVIEQIKNQLCKLVDVLDISELMPDNAIFRELSFIKVSANAKTRADIFSVVDIFRASIIDVSPSCITVEMTGDQSKIKAFVDLMEPYGVLEIVRTGLTGIKRGTEDGSSISTPSIN